MTGFSLQSFESLKERDLRGEGLLVAEGLWLTERLLSSCFEVLGIACTPSYAQKLRPLANDRCPLIVEKEETLSRIAGFPFHRGVLALARRPGPLSLELFLGGMPDTGHLLICPQIAEPENLGSVIRTAHAFGSSGLLIPQDSIDPFNRKVLRVSMGSAFILPVITMPELPDAPSILKSAGCRLIGTTLSHSATPLPSFRPPPRWALVLGNEALGLSDAWADSCDDLVTIPMASGIDSLNVGVAAGICLYGLTRC
jgi:tRNA G18 (ribose-2'-O)-methylase SpoU